MMNTVNKKISTVSRILIGVVVIFNCIFSARAASKLEEADEAYNKKDFRRALTLYKIVLDEKGASSNLYYNIGNANYRVGNTGNAIVAYERALRLDPSNTDARLNLDFVNSTVKGLPEDGSSFLSNIHRSVVSFTSPDKWAVIAFSLFMLILAGVAVYLFATNVTVRKAGFFGSLVMTVLFVYALVIAWQTASAPDYHDEAIVTAPNAKLTTTPGTAKSRTDKTIAIPEGSKVTIVDSLATPEDPVSPMWYNIRLNNNTEAWIGATGVERI